MPTKQSAQSTAQSHNKARHLAQRQGKPLKVVKENKQTYMQNTAKPKPQQATIAANPQAKHEYKHKHKIV